MKNISFLLNNFDSTSLKEMDSVKLMNRVDTKYILSIDQLTNLLSDAKENYRILEIKNQRDLQYKTTYFDTNDNKMFVSHQNGKLNRFKIRTREYVTSDIHFLEVKFKNNKGRTVKERIKRKHNGVIFCKDESKFLNESTPYAVNELKPKIWNKFSRLTLVHKHDKERITIDFNLSFKNNLGSKINLSKLVIIEAKQEKFNSKSDFLSLLKRNGIYDMRLSKYCIGSVLLNQDLKHNRFKSKLLALSKLEKQ